MSAGNAMSDARGAVFVEKLIVYLPLLAAFFATWELAELGAASLVVQRASAAAGRAAVVVLPDDPAFYDAESADAYDGQRRSDIELAAGMVLSSNPHLNADFYVDVTPPDDPSVAGGELEVTVGAPYDCGAVSFMCGGDGAIELTSTTLHAYQGARYTFGIPAELGGGGAALVEGGGGLRKRGTGDVDLGGTSQAVSGPGASRGCKKCKKASVAEALRRGHVPKVTDCSKVAQQLKDGVRQMKNTHAYGIKCIDKKQAIDIMAKDLKARAGSCECSGGGAPDTTNWNATASQQVNDNQCRAFTTKDDKIYMITSDLKQCQDDLNHEIIHVMAGPGGQTNYQGGSTNTLNESLTQYFTEEAFGAGGSPAYTEGNAGKWLDCFKKIGDPEAVCRAYFRGENDAMLDLLVSRYKQNQPTFSERNMTDAQLRAMIESKLGEPNNTFFGKVCKGQGTPDPRWNTTPGGNPPPPPGGPGGLPPPPPPPPGGLPPPGGMPPPPPPPPPFGG